MEGIHWTDLFDAMDTFLVSIVEKNVLLVYVMLFLIFFSETGLVFLAFLPGDSLLFVAGAVSALPQAQARGPRRPSADSGDRGRRGFGQHAQLRDRRMAG